MVDKWLAALQKSEPAVSTPSKPASDPLLNAIFGATDDVVAVDKTSKIVDDGSTEIPDPVEAFFEKDEKAKFRIPEVIVEPMHADGVFMEKTDGGVFKFTYERGHLVRSELFDEAGKRKGSVEEQPIPDVIVPTSLAKIIGLDEVVEVEVGE